MFSYRRSSSTKLSHKINTELDTVFLSFSALLLFLCAETLLYRPQRWLCTIIVESCCLYRDYSYTENLPILRVFSRENHVLNTVQELSLTLSQNKLIQENRTKLFSDQKAELGPLLPETPWLKCQKVLKFLVNNQTRLNPILGLGQLSVESWFSVESTWNSLGIGNLTLYH